MFENANCVGQFFPNINVILIDFTIPQMKMADVNLPERIAIGSL
jgi:hypothetical protein